MTARLRKNNVTVALDNSGIHSFVLADVDSISDVSCRVKNITFSPASVNCNDIGSVIPVTMTIQDNLDSTDACVSNVTIIDNTPPVITGCLPGISGIIRYLDANGRDTLWASQIPILDNCGSVFKEVRPLSSPIWRDNISFSCVSNFIQFWVRGTDPSGNMDSCRMVVQYRDTLAPTAICGNYTAYLTDANNGAVSVDPINVDAGSFDICPPYYWTLDWGSICSSTSLYLCEYWY